MSLREAAQEALSESWDAVQAHRLSKSRKRHRRLVTLQMALDQTSCC